MFITIERSTIEHENHLMYNGLSLGDVLVSKVDTDGVDDLETKTYNTTTLIKDKEYTVEYVYGNEAFCKDERGILISASPSRFNLKHTKNTIAI